MFDRATRAAYDVDPVRFVRHPYFGALTLPELAIVLTEHTRHHTRNLPVDRGRTTENSRVIGASPEALYGAFTDPAAIAVWLAPGDMTGKVHDFDGEVGGGYRMSLFYPQSEPGAPGKTGAHVDRFQARFVELTPFERIVEAITFDSPDPVFAGEMWMTVLFEPADGETRVTIRFEDIPEGIRPEDNEAGTESTLEKLARYVQSRGEVRAGG